MEVIFPTFNAAITLFSFASLSLIFTSIVPIADIIIPAPAIAIGSSTAPLRIPPTCSKAVLVISSIK